MKIRKLSTSFLILGILALAISPAFADKVGVVFEGDAAIQTSLSEALTADGHEIVDISAASKDVSIDSIAAAAIGKSTGAEIIVSGKKAGPIIILKVLSTKNDTVVGGTANEDGAINEQVKKLLADNKEKLAQW